MLIDKIWGWKFIALKKTIVVFFVVFRYQSGDQTPASEKGGEMVTSMPPPGDLDVKTQILQQQDLQKQTAAAAKAKGSSAPTSPMKEGKKASFFGKVILDILSKPNVFGRFSVPRRPYIPCKFFHFLFIGLNLFTSSFRQS